MRLPLLVVCVLFANVLAAQPEIGLERAGVAIASGSTDTVANPGTSPFNLNYVIRNDGSSDLTLTGLPVISNEDNCTVSLVVSPSSPVSAAGMTGFTLQVSPLSSSDFSFDVSIANDDSNENPYTFTFDAEPISPPAKAPSSSKSSGSCSTGDSHSNLWLLLGALAVGVICVKPASGRRFVD